jgi:transposase
MFGDFVGLVARLLADAGKGEKSGQIALDEMLKADSPTPRRREWEKAWKIVRQEFMPPVDAERPSAEERKAITQWIEQNALGIDYQNPDPGRVTIRRLNRMEYEFSLTDLFGVSGLELLDRLDLAAPYAARVASLRRLLDDLDFEIDLFARLARGRLANDPGYRAVQEIPGIGPVLGAVFVAEVGDVTRFDTAAQLACWAGLTPKHRESDTHVHRGRITKQGSRLVRWAAVESVQILPTTSKVGQIRERIGSRRGHNIGVVAAARQQVEYVFYALRDHHVRALHHRRAVA